MDGAWGGKHFGGVGFAVLVSPRQKRNKKEERKKGENRREKKNRSLESIVKEHAITRHKKSNFEGVKIKEGKQNFGEVGERESARKTTQKCLKIKK